MSRYLSALKNSENSGGANLKNLKNPLDGSSLGFLGTSPTPFEKNQAANDGTEQAVEGVRFSWLIHFADRESVTVTFSPMVTHAAALACYPDAVAAEPVGVASMRRILSRDEELQLRSLIEIVYREDTESERQEALQAALADPDNALACYTAIASERGLIFPDSDDRRTCRQCSNLTHGGLCSVASPGGAVSAIRGYRPVADLLQRCEAFNEK